MAKDVTNNIWRFDAAADAEGIANVGVTGVVFDQAPIYVQWIRVDTGNGGNFLINETNGADEVLKLDSMPSDDSLERRIDSYVRGLYLQTLPTNATVSIKTGVPDVG